MNRISRPRHAHRLEFHGETARRPAQVVLTLLHDSAPDKYYLRMLDGNRRTSGPPLIGVGAVLLSADLRQVLLVQRGTAPAKGQWSVPGGLVERTERLREACQREVLEETGLHAELRPDPVKLLERLIPGANGNAEYHYLIVDFWGHAAGGTLRAGSDVLHAAWVPVTELADLDVTQGLAAVVERTLAVARNEPPSAPLLETW